MRSSPWRGRGRRAEGDPGRHRVPRRVRPAPRDRRHHRGPRGAPRQGGDDRGRRRGRRARRPRQARHRDAGRGRADERGHPAGDRRRRRRRRARPHISRSGSRCSAHDPRIPRAITVVFFVNGALFASWASRIPALSDRVGATPGTLGLALLAPAVGAIVAMPLVGKLLPGRSSRSFTRLGVIAADGRDPPAAGRAHRPRARLRAVRRRPRQLDARPLDERPGTHDRAPAAASRFCPRCTPRSRSGASPAPGWGRWPRRSASHRSPTSPPRRCCSGSRA